MVYTTPMLAVEQSLRQFTASWHIGLQPCLNIRTELDGTIIISTDMTCSWPMIECDADKTATNSCRRSGKGARSRRNARRNELEKHRQSAVEEDPADTDANHIVDFQSKSNTNEDVSIQTDLYHEEIQGLESKINDLTVKISRKECRIMELETIISTLKRPQKHLSAVCVENTNVPPVNRNCKCFSSTQ